MSNQRMFSWAFIVSCGCFSRSAGSHLINCMNCTLKLLPYGFIYHPLPIYGWLSLKGSRYNINAATPNHTLELCPSQAIQQASNQQHKTWHLTSKTTFIIQDTCKNVFEIVSIFSLPLIFFDRIQCHHQILENRIGMTHAVELWLPSNIVHRLQFVMWGTNTLRWL